MCYLSSQGSQINMIGLSTIAKNEDMKSLIAGTMIKMNRSIEIVSKKAMNVERMITTKKKQTVYALITGTAYKNREEIIFSPIQKLKTDLSSLPRLLPFLVETNSEA